MQTWTYGIWFLGAGVWLVAAALSLRLHSPARTIGAIAVAVLFFAAGLFFARAANVPRRRP